MPPLERNGKIVILASAFRSLDYGFLSIFLGVYLSLLGFSVFEAGLIFSAIMAGGALSNLISTYKGDRIGRKRMLVCMSTLMVAGGLLYPLASNLTLFIFISLFAMTTSTGGDRTAFLSLDMAILSQLSENQHRTMIFSIYNLVGMAGKSLGALLILAPVLFQSWLYMEEVSSFKAVFAIYSLIAFSGIVIYSRLSPAAELIKSDLHQEVGTAQEESRHIIYRLAILSSIDAFGGGFMIRSFISFWFAGRFGTTVDGIAGIFFAGQLLNMVSVWVSAPVARKIGLIKTMVYTQIISNLLLGVMALAGNFWICICLYLLRELSNDMDVPTRQSYMMAIVPEKSRTKTAGMTNLARTVAQTVSPTIGGILANLTFLGMPFLIGSGIKLVYNGALFLMFRDINAPEEIPRVKPNIDTNN